MRGAKKDDTNGRNCNVLKWPVMGVGIYEGLIKRNLALAVGLFEYNSHLFNDNATKAMGNEDYRAVFGYPFLLT